MIFLFNEQSAIKKMLKIILFLILCTITTSKDFYFGGICGKTKEECSWEYKEERKELPEAKHIEIK